MVAVVATEWGTLASVLFTAAIGYFSFRTAERASRESRADKAKNEDAKLQAEEVAGWKTLIATSRMEYEAAIKDRAELRLELGRTQGELKAVYLQLESANARVRELEKDIALLHAIIRTRTEDRLGVIEDRLIAEEARNTDIEALATLAGERADTAERRADVAEKRADVAHDRADESEHRADESEHRTGELEKRTLEPDPDRRHQAEH